MTQQTMTKEQWKYSEHTHALADTGDYEWYVQFTNERKRELKKNSMAKRNI